MLQPRGALPGREPLLVVLGILDAHAGAGGVGDQLRVVDLVKDRQPDRVADSIPAADCGQSTSPRLVTLLAARSSVASAGRM